MFAKLGIPGRSELVDLFAHAAPNRAAALMAQGQPCCTLGEVGQVHSERFGERSLWAVPASAYADRLSRFSSHMAAGRAVRCGHARTLASHMDRTERPVAECVVAFPQVKPTEGVRALSLVNRGLGVQVPSPAPNRLSSNRIRS